MRCVFSVSRGIDIARDHFGPFRDDYGLTLWHCAGQLTYQGQLWPDAALVCRHMAYLCGITGVLCGLTV